MRLFLVAVSMCLFSMGAMASNGPDFKGVQTVKVVGFVPYNDTAPLEEGTYFHTDTSVSGTILCTGKEKMPIVRVFNQDTMAQIGYYTFNSLSDCLEIDRAIKMYGNSSTKNTLSITFDHDKKKVTSYSVNGGSLPSTETAKIVGAIPYSDTGPGEEGTFFHTDTTLQGTMLCSGKDKMPVVRVFENQAQFGYYTFDSVEQCVQDDDLIKSNGTAPGKSVYITVDHKKGSVVSVIVKK